MIKRSGKLGVLFNRQVKIGEGSIYILAVEFAKSTHVVSGSLAIPGADGLVQIGIRIFVVLCSKPTRAAPEENFWRHLAQLNCFGEIGECIRKVGSLIVGVGTRDKHGLIICTAGNGLG